AVEDMEATQDALTAYLQDRKADLLNKIIAEGKIDNALEADLKSAIEDFKSANK
ncbi:MAG: F0F1 ATP synthase subunit alpha, partial [Verrucomicrobiales bacterium]|nr:F0F1 ATP synthase subunit alpha [Verrucomicrobiales bacterium]